MAWTEKQLKQRGYTYPWTLDETLDLISDTRRIPYLGFCDPNSQFPKEAPEIVLSLAPKDENSELSVRNYAAMLRMLKQQLSSSGGPEVETMFLNLGTSGLRWDKCGGETPFLTISTRVHRHGLAQQINFVLDDPATYHAVWSDPLSALERRMENYRGPNVYSAV